jgi:glycerol-3-phosphate acyltransferase PlsX
MNSSSDKGLFHLALDCMGGDYAPYEIVKGGIEALKIFPDLYLYLVGKEEDIEKIIAPYKKELEGRYEIVPADEIIAMDEPPLKVLRKKNSSLYKAAELVKEKKADALVSAGNTGAVLTVGKFVVGAIEELERPSIAVAFPTTNGKPTILLDVGANVDVKPKHLLQFAIIGHTYAEEILNIKNPKIGILSIGEEEGKGNELVKEAYPLLKASKLNFKGNAEGRDIFTGEFDVIVCDGFVGNIVLKASESLGISIIEMLKKEVKRSLLARIGAFLMRGVLNRLKKKADFAEYGGTPLLGAKAPIIVTHGKANYKAIVNAIRSSRQFYIHHFNQVLSKNLKKFLNGTNL